jgi:peptidoglycan/xylan/chitin deacetylase (PgdA/CDA1 family)
VLKGLVENVMVSSGVLRLARHRVRHHSLILAYHNIVPHGEVPAGDRSLHLPQRAFAEQLDLLQTTHEVVALHDLLEPETGARHRPRAALTFDDAYRGAVTAGVTEVVRRGLPATIFVAPAFVGATFWWDALAPGGGFPDHLREDALVEARGEDAAVRRWAVGHGLHPAPVPAHAKVGSEAELLAAAQHPGITWGSHSWSHPNLARLSGAELAAELQRPLQWLEQRFPRRSAVIAYPYGLTSPAVERAAAAAGYRAGLLVAGGWASGDDDPYRLPRLNIPAGLSLNGFRIRAAGVWCQ